ncbi:hypothetical protein RHRU231_370008 [Rhodococcus ruber]|uniref:Uncharacterized protein n=1 Tax=Rhodococcus ruber TaxID=1830 RepID=A0A098BJY4_9NOCA|nr:hypothetical protein RHRU231_370008 [Rhodococcus ruber]
MRGCSAGSARRMSHRRRLPQDTAGFGRGSGRPRRGPARSVAEHQCRTERSAGSAVDHPGGGRHDVARGEQPGDDAIVDVEDRAVGVGARAALRAERAAVDLHRVEGRPRDRPQGGFHARVLVLVTDEAVVHALAAVVFAVVTPSHVLVPVGHRRLERGRGDLDLPCEIGEGVRTHHPLRCFRTRRGPERSVLLDMVGVEDQPAGLVRVVEVVCVEMMERTAEGVVVGCLVGEPASVPVHHDRMRRSPFPVYELDRLRAVRPLPGQHRDRRPPCLAHVAELRADTHRHAQTVPRARGDRGRVRQRPPQEVAPQTLVPFEAAGGKDDAVLGEHVVRAAPPLEPHTCDAAGLVLDQPHAALAGVHRHALVETALEQCRDHATAETLHVVALALLLHVGRKVAGATADGGLRDRHTTRDPDELVLPPAEVDEAEQLRFERASAVRHATGPLGVVVGVPGDEAHLQRCGVEPLQQFGNRVDERLGEFGQDHPVRQRLEVGEGPLTRVGDSRLPRVPVVRQPRHGARQARGAAEQFALLEHAHPGAAPGSRQRGAQSGGSAAEHDDVVLGRFFVVLHRNPSLGWFSRRRRTDSVDAVRPAWWDARARVLSQR